MLKRQVIEGEYGTTVIHDDGKREPTQAERDAARRADQIDVAELLKAFHCSPAELDTLLNHPDFPARLGLRPSGRFWGRQAPYFSRRAINERFIAKYRAIAALLPESV